MMTEPGLQKPLDLRLGERIATAAGLEIHFHGKPGAARVPQGDLGGNVVAPAEQRLHPRGQLHLPLLFPAGQDIREERTHFPFPGQRVTLGCPLPRQKTGGQQLSLRHPLGLPPTHPVPPGIAGVRHPGVHALVLTGHAGEDVTFISVDRLQLTADAGKEAIQLHPDLGEHRFKLELAQSIPSLQPHVSLQ